MIHCNMILSIEFVIEIVDDRYHPVFELLNSQGCVVSCSRRTVVREFIQLNSDPSSQKKIGVKNFTTNSCEIQMEQDWRQKFIYQFLGTNAPRTILGFSGAFTKNLGCESTGISA